MKTLLAITLGLSAGLAFATVLSGVATTPRTSSPAAARVKFETWFAAVLAEHERSERDPEWADATERAFRHHFAAIAFETELISDIDCRRHGCVAILTWRDYAAAAAGYRVATGASTCAPTIALPEPADARLPYVTMAYFDCAQQELQ